MQQDIATNVHVFTQRNIYSCKFVYPACFLSTDITKKCANIKFCENPPSGTQGSPMRNYKHGRLERHDKVNSRFKQFYKDAYKQYIYMYIYIYT